MPGNTRSSKNFDQFTHWCAVVFAEFTETDFRDGFSLAISFAKTVQGDFGVDDSAVRRYRLTS